MTGPEGSRREALRVLDAWAADPTGGLPEELFHFLTRLLPIVNVDLLIQDERGRTLLTWRDDAWYGAGWHIPGGIIRYKETAEARIRATALRELGATVEHDPAPLAIDQAIAPERRERGHFVALLYRCRLTSEPAESLRFAGGKPSAGQWAWHESCPQNLMEVHRPYRRYFAAPPPPRQ